MTKLRGSEIVVQSLVAEGVETVFGYPGGQVLDIFDAIYGSPVNLILTRHEQGAAHAADGFSRATGRVGVCLATSGPGATNLVTGIATAYMDSIPMVAITGQVPSHLIGNDAFQEADIVGITRPITKHNYLVRDVEELAQTFKNAFHIARTGRPGPVLIDIPKNVQQAEAKFKYPDKVHLPGYNPTFKGHFVMIKRVAEAIAQAKRPLIYAGGGVIAAEAAPELFRLATEAHIPVTTTLLGLGAFPETHPLALKMLGMHGTRYANFAVQNCDLLIAIGARFDDRVTGKLAAFAPHAKIVHIDVDPSAISKNVVVDIPLVGDCKQVLQQLLEVLKPGELPDTTEWLKQIQQWKEQYPLNYERDERLHPQYVVEKICELAGGEAVICTEVGQNQMWSCQFYTHTRPRAFVSSGGLGTMGYGFPAALGAKMGCPDRLVIDVAGDGSIQMNIQELATAVVNEINVKIVILNNSYLGMVRQWQKLFYRSRYSATCLQRRKECPTICNSPGTDCAPYTPDFVKLAEAYGAEGYRVCAKADVEPTLKAAFASDKVSVIEFVVEKEENVFPMVPAGAALDEMLEEVL